MRFDQLKIGFKAKITAFNKGTSSYRKRLIALGLLPGTVFMLSRIAPFGDPIEIEVRGALLSLRKAEASLLQIEEV